MHRLTVAGRDASPQAAQPPSELLTAAALRDLRHIADEIAGTDIDPVAVEGELLADIDAAIFEAQHDLAHRADRIAQQRIRTLNRQRDWIIRAWHAAVGQADYHVDKLSELAEAPDAATAADAVSRWGLLSGRRTSKPFPAAAPAIALPKATDADLHAAVSDEALRFFTDADQPGVKARTLIVAQTGSRKTGLALAALRQAIERRKAAGQPHRAVWLVTEHRLGAEALKRANAAGLSAAVFRGRSAATCQNLEAVTLARQAGADIKRTVCGPTRDGQCFARGWCGADGYFAGMTLAADADVVIAAHNYLTEPLPEALRKGVAWVIVDEDFTGLIDWERAVTRETFTAEPLERSPVRDDQGQPDRTATDELSRHFDVIHRATGACIGGYLTADALHEAGFGRLDMARTRSLLWARKVPVLMFPGMDPDSRREASRLAAVNGQLPGLVALTYALEQLATGDPAAAGLVSVRLDERRSGSQVVITARGQREPAAWLCDLPVLMLGATSRIADIRRAFPDARLAGIERAAEPHSTVHQIVGGFGRSTLARHKTRLAELRDLINVATMGKDVGLVVTHLSCEDQFAGMPGIVTAHHGNIAGHDVYRDVDAAFIIGGAFASPAAIASLAAARGGGAVAVAKPTKVMRSALLTSGEAVGIEVMAYPDPAADAVHRGIYDTSIIQAAGRPRPLERSADNPSISYIFANVALPFPVDTVSRWQEVRPDRVVRMIASGAVWTNSADMARFRSDLFKSQKAAESDRSRCVGSIDNMREAVRAIVRNDTRPWIEITYQPPGQGHKRRSVFTPEGAAAAVRHGIEAEWGKPIVWRVRLLTYGKEDTLTPGKSIIYPIMRESSTELVVEGLPAWTLPTVNVTGRAADDRGSSPGAG